MNTLRSSIFAGIVIGAAGFGFLATKDIVGAALFSFGLLTVVNYSLRLYTGTAGFIHRGELGQLLIILLGNLIGCLLASIVVRQSPMPLQESAQSILEGRLAIGPLRGGLLAMGCGLIMTTAVTFARKGQFLPLLFGVPLFITCGFPHCIADAFYYMCVPLDYLTDHAGELALFYPAIVLGNFIGCNLYRIVVELGTNK
ncbi:MAG: formate/nitrite transporter family protein [Bacteroidales bacterium]|nr:formate/nitrite transporter family protein [Candidatus Physcousia equi]